MAIRVGIRKQLERHGMRPERLVLLLEDKGIWRSTFTVQNWLAGRGEPSEPIRDMLCEIFGCTMDELHDRSNGTATAGRR